jgi:8-oxo-dGTP diphosphatase
MLERIVDVAVGVIIRANGDVLLGDRPADKPWPGWWELPGGKIEPGETVLEALRRELAEEIGIEVTRATPWVTHIHRYPKSTVRLHFCRVLDWSNEPCGLEGQNLKWVSIEAALEREDLLPATYPPLRWLQLPDRYLISSATDEWGLAAFLTRLHQGFQAGIKLVQWREPNWQLNGNPQSLERAFNEVLALCHAHGARLLVNSVHPRDWGLRADGLHLRAADAHALKAHPEELKHLEGKLLGVSTHNTEDLAVARALQADFAVLGPVLQTPSHPGEPSLGWDAFENINREAGLPVYAIGGQRPDTRLQAQSRGGHGIAGIGQLLG